MDDKKTVIWHGGLAALLASDPAAEPQPEERVASRTEREPPLEMQVTRVEMAAPELLRAMQAEARAEAEHGQRAEESRPVAESAAVQASEPTQQREAAQTSESPPQQPRRAPNYQRSQASGTRIMGSWLTPEVQKALATPPAPDESGPGEPAAASNEPPVTRVLPIETLFPQGQSSESAPVPQRKPDAEPAPQPSAQRAEAKLPQPLQHPQKPATAPTVRRPARAFAASTKLRGLLAGKGRERVLLYGGLALFVVVALGFRAFRESARDPSSTTRAQAAATTSAPTARRDTSDTGKALPAAVALPTAAALSAPEGLERAATDALARGDYVLAQRIYTELAKRVPAPSPYSEAARILARAAEPEPR
jgi:hypothetical protein